MLELHKDCRRTIYEFADTVGISCGVCQEITTENVNVCRIVAKSVPQLSTNDQKQRRIDVCLELREKRLTRSQLLPLFRFVSQVENETEGTTF
jgi:hypothetical protein